MCCCCSNVAAALALLLLRCCSTYIYVVLQIGGGEAKKNTQTTNVKRVPTFELRVQSDCMLTLILSGNVGVAADLRVYVSGASGELVANHKLGEDGAVRIPMKLASVESPFQLVLDSQEEDVLENLEVDFECDGKLEVELLEQEDDEES